MLDRLMDGIMVLGHDWRVRYINEPAGLMLGRPHNELTGTNILEEFPEVIGHPFHVTFSEAMSTGEPRRLIEHYEPLGRWFEARAYPQEDKLVNLFRDVTEEQRAENDLREQVERMSEAEQIVRFGSCEWDLASGRVRWSAELMRIYGLRPGEFQGTPDDLIEHVHPDDRERVSANIATAMQTLQPFIFEQRIVRPDGAERVLLSQGRVIADDDGSPRTLLGVCNDITDRAKAEAALGASERRMRAIIDNTPSLITVKDLSGRYLMGNAESKRVADVGSEELVGRYCSDLFPPEIAVEQRRRDRRAASEGKAVYDEVTLVRDGEDREYVTVTFPLPDEQGLPIETCTIATDVTERKIHESGEREREEWSERITGAVADDRLLVFAQPIVDVDSGVASSNELLVRLRTVGDRSEVLAPAAFLPAAERFGLIQIIDLWMVRRAVALSHSLLPHVNLSAVTICDRSARREILDLLRSHSETASRIVFEITETASVAQLEAAQAFAADVTAIGCKLALDDFGVGFGSFTYLRSLPLDYIKIDVSFVRGLADSRDDRRVVQGIIGIAHEFGLKTIAEGVEDERTLELLREMGTDLVQGYHFGRPAPLMPAA